MISLVPNRLARDDRTEESTAEQKRGWTKRMAEQPSATYQFKCSSLHHFNGHRANMATEKDKPQPIMSHACVRHHKTILHIFLGSEAAKMRGLRLAICVAQFATNDEPCCFDASQLFCEVANGHASCLRLRARHCIELHQLSSQLFMQLPSIA